MKNLNTLLSKRSNKNLKLNCCRISFLIALIVLNIHTAFGQFDPSAIPNKIFPKPVYTIPVPTFTLPGLLYWPTFYNERSNGSCYSTTADFDPFIPGDENIYVWAIGFTDVAGYEHAVAYEVTDVSHNIIYRGTAYLGADIANLQVGLYTPNGTNYHLVVAYWYAGGSEIRLTDYTMTGTGLSSPVTSVLYSLSNTTSLAQHISLDCHGGNTFTVAWEDEGYPLHMVGFDYDPATPESGMSGIQAIGTSNSRLPDIAMAGRATYGDPNYQLDVHLACVEVTAPPVFIREYKVDFASMFASTPPFTFTLEDNYNTGGSFGPDWDDFQLRIDAPDNHTGNPKWAYTFFNDDQNKIKVRINNVGLYYNVVMNDGIGLPSLINLTTAGNAFPTITWNNTSTEIYVGWYTNYDNTLPGPPAPNNPLYTYTANTEGYISALIDDVGNSISNRYSNVDVDRYTNRIGTFIDPARPWSNMYWPKICFSKNNDCAQMFALFSSHDTKPNLIWNIGGGSWQGRYWEFVGAPNYTWPFPREEQSDINYLSATGGIISAPATSVFLSQKQVNWYNGSTGVLFKKTQEKDIISKNDEVLNIRSNPFSKENIFQLNGGDAKAQYTAELKSIDGKKIAAYKGSVSTLNAIFKTMNTDLLPSGIYTLSVSSGKEHKYEFKLVKQ